MKKVAILHFAYPPNIGGVESMIKEHADIMVNMGYDVTVVAGSGEESSPKIKLIVIPELQSVLSFNPFLQEKILEKGEIDDDFYKLAEKIGQELEKALEEIDVVIVHNMMTIVRNLPFVYAFKNYIKKNPKKKYFAWTHDHSYVNEFKIKNLDEVSHSKFEREILTTPIDSLHYILISESFMKPFIELMGLKPENITVIPDGIDIKQFLEIDDFIWEVVEKYDLTNRFPLVLSPVNIMDRKNLEYCLDIIAELKPHYPKIKYVITGKPSQHHSTQEYLSLLKKKAVDLGIKDNILFFNDFLTRALVRTEVHDLYQIADIIFFMSKSENFGLPLLEASLSKTPIFVSDLKVFREVGGDFIKYLDYKTVSARDAAISVKDFLDNSRRVKMNYHSRTRFDLKTIIKELFVPLMEK
jgi:glycosyltransferase involved in cell wall biosynthesis